MKTVKNYRLSPTTIKKIQALKTMLPEWTETEIVEAAIDLYYITEKPFQTQGITPIDTQNKDFLQKPKA